MRAKVSDISRGLACAAALLLGASCVSIVVRSPPQVTEWPPHAPADYRPLRVLVETDSKVGRLHRMDLLLAMREEYARSQVLIVVDEGDLYHVRAKHVVDVTPVNETVSIISVFVPYAVTLGLLPAFGALDLRHSVSFHDAEGTLIAATSSEARTLEMFALSFFPLAPFLHSDAVHERLVRQMCRASLSEAFPHLIELSARLE